MILKKLKHWLKHTFGRKSHLNDQLLTDTVDTLRDAGVSEPKITVLCETLDKIYKEYRYSFRRFYR